MNWDNLDWSNFSCVDMARKIKAEISAELNAMTREERLCVYERNNTKYCQKK